MEDYARLSAGKAGRTVIVNASCIFVEDFSLAKILRLADLRAQDICCFSRLTRAQMTTGATALLQPAKSGVSHYMSKAPPWLRGDFAVSHSASVHPVSSNSWSVGRWQTSGGNRIRVSETAFNTAWRLPLRTAGSCSLVSGGVAFPPCNAQPEA